MDQEKQRQSLQLATYMLVCARQLFGEPAHYGPIRLVEATVRFLDLLGADEKPPDWLDALSELLKNTNGVVRSGSQAYLDRLDEAIAWTGQLLASEDARGGEIDRDREATEG